MLVMLFNGLASVAAEVWAFNGFFFPADFNFLAISA